MYSYVFWVAESDSEVKIAIIACWYNLKKLHIWVCDGKTCFFYGTQAADIKVEQN